MGTKTTVQKIQKLTEFDLVENLKKILLVNDEDVQDLTSEVEDHEQRIEVLENSSGGGGDISGKEDKINKQNSLTIDGTGVKYPTVDAINNPSNNLVHKNGDEIIDDSKSFTGEISVAVSQTKQIGRYIYFIGDSYTAGTGATPVGNRFSTLTASMLGYSETNDGIGGSKLSKRLPDANNFVDRIALVPNYDIDLAPYIVIAGGFNDAVDLANSANYTTANYTTDYQTIITTLISTKGYPANHIVIVTPWYSTITANTARLVAFKDAALNVASTNNTLVFDAYTYFLNNSGIELLNAYGDGNHVANDGHRVIAQEISRVIGYSVQKDGQKLVVNGNTELGDLTFRTLSNNPSIQEVGLDANGRLTIDKTGHIRNVIDGLKQAANIAITGYTSLDKDLTVGANGTINKELSVGTNLNIKPSAGVYPSVKTGLLITNNGVRTYIDSYTSSNGTGAPLHIQNLTAGDIKLYGNTEVVSKTLTVGSGVISNSYINSFGGTYPTVKKGLLSVGDGSVSYIDSYTSVDGVGAPLRFQMLSAGDIKLYGNTEVMGTKTLTVGGITIHNGTVRLKSYLVGTLPPGVEGDTAYVTDATAPTYLGTLTGGGTIKCPVFYNGTAWVSH